MSRTYKKSFVGMTTNFLEIKLCKTCKENLNYKKFREVKP